jgi:Bifunctional DNA primase/polymerase, N-terminal
MASAGLIEVAAWSFWTDTEPKPCKAAQWYVRQRRWAVTPGTYLAGGTCSCEAAACTAPGAHPALAAWRSTSTTDPGLVHAWWREQANASIVLPTGYLFDVLDLPAQPGLRGLQRLELMGAHLGPVARTLHDRVLIWVTTGARVLADVVAAKDLTYGGLDIRCHSAGGYVVAPPSRGTTWINPPTRCWCLPLAADIIGTIVQACMPEPDRPMVNLPTQREALSVLQPDLPGQDSRYVAEGRTR